MQIFVLGMHRSGTSAIARILNLMGVYFGGEHVGTGRSDENAKGFWERRDVRDLNDDILFNSRCDWDCVTNFDLDTVPVESTSAYASAAAEIVLNMDAHRPWFVKEPRLCLLFPVWRQALENPCCIHVLRNPLEVAHSLRTRNGIPIRAGVALWEIYNLRALNGSAGLPRVLVPFDDLMANASALVERLHAALAERGGFGLRVPSSNELSRFLDAELYRHRKTERSLRSVATAHQLKLYEALRGDIDSLPASLSQPSRSALEILGRYEKTVDIEDRIARARRSRQRRVPESEATQLKLRNLELEHARSSLKDVAQRLGAAERETRELRRYEIESRSVIARHIQKVEDVRETVERLEEDRSALGAKNADLEKDRSALQQLNAKLGKDIAVLRDERSTLVEANAQLESAQVAAGETTAALHKDLEAQTRLNASLSEEIDGLRVELGLLQDTNARLEEKGVIVEQARVRAENGRAALAAKLHRASEEVAGRQSLVRDLVFGWDRELSHRKDMASELALLAAALHSDIAGLLGSRRWRLGRAIISALHVLSLRRVPTDVGVELNLANARYRAKEQLIGHFATARDDLPRKLAELAPTTAASVDEILDNPGLRPAEMTVRLVERGLELKRRAQQVDELSAYVDSLVAIFEGIVGSWRWRLGNLAISTLRRLVPGKMPATAADSAATLVDQYRAGSYAEVARRPVVPFPQGSGDATRGGQTRGSASNAPSKAGADGRRGDGKDTKPAIRVPPGNRAVVPTPLVPIVARKGTAAELQDRRTVRPSLPESSIDIVVCVHDALEDVKRCLESVLSRTAMDFRLIVVNDGSGPETTTWLRRRASRHPLIDLIETDGPLGYTRAANRGLKATTRPYVALLNSDTIVPRLWVESLLQCLQSDDRLGIVGPLSNAASWQSIPDRFAEGGGWATNELPAGYNVDEYGELVHRMSERAFPRVRFLNGFCLVMRREVIDAVGHLDEEAFPQGYGEENDYCIRARAAGYRLAVADHCFVYHAKSKSFGAEARDRLAEAGRKALWDKHGEEVVEEGTRELKAEPALARIRSRMSSFFALPPQLGIGGSVPRASGASPASVLFVIPVRGGSGGANSVVQEVAGMRFLGVDARIAVDARHAESMGRFYADVLEPESRVVFASEAELLSACAPFDVIVATLWSTPALIAPIAERWPEKAYVYYVQDYEPWFFPDDPASRAIALDSYTRVPNMALMAKTDWICRTVRQHHGVDVFRVAPSLDHDVFYAGGGSSGGAVALSAMIRPSTPRRAPLRTLRVLRELARAFDGLRILLFGCETRALEDLARNDPEFELDFAFENRGILTRRDVAGLLRESDIFVDLSDYQAFGRTGLEAMACGCATVLPARGGADEYVVDGENAFLVDTESFEHMTSTIARLIKDRSLREMIRERSLATAARYSVMRASLSELAVFRWAWVVRSDAGSHGDVHGRGIEPASGVGTS